ncbi:hypothetical protein [Nonomuraea pusilla]|uniref:Uncharacterized protein n=1 Tax=Nonomuraea pusilla TaxID=46177 RepID=A0A1H8HQY8_9ACTN|nr:hypothetical protein [Nonomuraea pusilla]SEN58700.1 hypothetical protein SAMN05660976_07871 [Nonomuraea pusilla]
MDIATGRPIVILDNGAVGQVVLAQRSERAGFVLVLVLGMDGTLVSCELGGIACVVGGTPFCHDG